ncbi:fibronectin type III domain-containing protein, partial [Amycolatopsis sp. H20-H5]|uniref:fibronectin type III domain-containing protein n=1 Tax=Amycolatopsis sp. H20-H5 TaxID=3046309 RepID=UPI002DBA82CE
MNGTTPAPGARTLVANSAGGGSRSSAWRRRVPVALIAVLCAAAVTLALTGAAKPPGGMQFLPVGHWVYNLAAQSAFHVDGATSSIDAQAPVPGDEGSQVVQGDTSGYVVGSGRITEFGKSNLSVERSVTPPSAEPPVGVETAGGPYLVYRDSGQIVRLGDPAATLTAGGPVGDPVATGDGTLWLFRTGSGLLCEVPRGADRISSCPATAAKGHTGVLTLVADQPRFVDTTDGTIRTLGPAGFGASIPLGVKASPGSSAAANDVSGRVAILDRAGHRLYLVDAGNPAVRPVTVPLPDGDYAVPVSTGSVVALVDKKSGTLLTYDGAGKPTGSKPIPPEAGPPRLTRGEDARVYVDGAQGAHVLVVDHDGKIADVPVVGDHSGDAPKPVTPPDATTLPPADQRQSPETPPSPQNPPRQTGPPATGTQQPSAPPKTKPTPPTPPTAPASPPGAPASVSAGAG